MFSDYDKDKTGFLSRDNFARFIKDAPDDVGPEKEKLVEFDLADEDGDG